MSVSESVCFIGLLYRCKREWPEFSLDERVLAIGGDQTNGLFSLQSPRLTRDLIEVHSIMRGIDWINCQDRFFQGGKEMSKTRKHNFKIRGRKWKGEDVWGKFFLQNMVWAWSKVPGVVVEVVFQKVLDRYMEMYEWEGHGSHVRHRGCNPVMYCSKFYVAMAC